MTSDSSQMYNMPTGVYVSNVISGGGAKNAGITKGCVITELEGTTVDSMSALKEELQYYKVGEKVKVTIQVPNSNGSYKERTVKVTLGKSIMLSRLRYEEAKYTNEVSDLRPTAPAG